MSADSHSVCPKCHPEDLNKVGVWQNFDSSGTGDVRENYETYWRSRQVEPIRDPGGLGLFLVAEYSADCWTCGWHFEITTETPLTGLS
jgi:hypothetical protein